MCLFHFWFWVLSLLFWISASPFWDSILAGTALSLFFWPEQWKDSIGATYVIVCSVKSWKQKTTWPVTFLRYWVHFKIDLLFFFFLPFIWVHWVFTAACELSVVACGIQFPKWGSNPGSLYWDLKVLATEPPEKSLLVCFSLSFRSLCFV